MRASKRTRRSISSTAFAEGRIPLALLSFFVLATASATLDDATTNENLPANTIVGTLSLGVGTGPTNQFNIGFTQKEAHVTLTQSGYWKPATNTFRKFLVDESGDSLFGGFSGVDTDSSAQVDFNSSGISGWSGMNETQKRRKVLEITGYYKLYKMSLDVDGSSNPNAITRESRDDNVTGTAWNPSWKDNAYEIHRIDVEGWNGDENGSYDRLRDKYLILPQSAKDDVFQIISTGEPTTSNPVVGQLRDSYNLKYDQTTSSHGSSSHLHTSGAPADLAKNGSGDGSIKNSDYDGTTTEKWNVTYHNNGHKEFKITDGGAFNATTGEFTSVDRYSRVYKDPDWINNGFAGQTQATDSNRTNRQVVATKLSNNVAVTNHDVASISLVGGTSTTRSVQVGRKYEWDVINNPFHSSWTGWSTLSSGSVNDYDFSTWGYRDLSSADKGYIAGKMATNDDRQGTNLTSGILQGYLNSWDQVQTKAVEVEAGAFDRNDWTVTVKGRNKVYSDNYSASGWVFKQYYNETYEDFVFDLDTNWANVTDPRETLNYKFLATPVDVMESRTIVLSEGTGQTQPDLTFSLVEGNGSQHNHLFSVDGNGRLKNAEPLDHESNPTLSIRIRAVDDLNVSLEKPLVISVIDVPEAPSFASSGVTLSMPENSVAAFTFTATDPDANTTLLYSLSGPDAGRFALNVVTGILTLSQPPDFENPNDADANGVYQVSINATDGEANATQNAAIAISNANDPPVDIHLSGTTIAENQPVGIIVGELNATDPDANATVTFSFADGNGSQHNSLFSLDSNGTVRTTAILDYEANATLNIRVKVTDDENASLTQALVVSVLNDLSEDLDGDGLTQSQEVALGTSDFNPDTDGDGLSDYHEANAGSNPLDANSTANLAPTGIALDKIFVMENQSAGTEVGHLVVTDPNQNDSHTLSLADANGSSLDNALFSIDANGTLRTTAPLDYESKWLLRLRVKATDANGSSFEQTLGVAVRDDPADQNHRLLAFGQNHSLQLGIGSQNVPLQVAPPGSGFVKVAAGQNHGSLFVKSDGSLWGAGSKLGGEDSYRDLGPSQLDAGPVTSYAIGGYSSGNYALWTRQDGSLWVVGYGNYGKFGNGNSQQQNIYEPQKLLSSGVTSVAAGMEHSLIVKTDGSLWTTGRNDKGQLGDDTNETRDTWFKVVDANVTAVFAGSSHSLFLKNDGTLWGMGNNWSGLLGDGTTVDSLIPVQSTISNVVSFSAESSRSFVVKADGSLWKTKSNAANGWEQLVDANVTAVESGHGHTTFTKTDGSLWTIGNSTYGQLGDGAYARRDSNPERVMDFGVISAAGGGAHTVFAKSDGSLWAMGDNSNGQFGSGDTSNPKRPVEVLSSGVTAANPSGFGYALKNDGALLYHGSGVPATRPEEYLPSGVLQVANPYLNLVYLKDNGSLWRLKHHPRIDEELVSSGVAVVAGPNGWPGGHALFIKENGSLWGFGKNNYGQLGDGTTADREEPVQIVAGEVVAAAASGYHSLFIKTDGSFWAMGKNQYGQLGDGTTVERHTPVKVVDDGVIGVTTGSNHTLFLKEDGSLWAMGWNHRGQLGDGTTQSQHFPVKVVDSGVIAMAAGYGSSGQVESLMVKTDGSLWSVGSNEYGQLGDGTLEDRPTWTKVLDTGAHGVTASGNSVFVFAEPNQAPTDVTLAPSSVLENQPAGTIAGELNATDPDVFLNPQSFTYAFADGNGSQHNSLFSLDSNGTVRATAILDYEANATLNIRVKVTDDENASLEQTLTIAVTNVIEDLDGDGIEDHADLDDDGDGFTDAREIEGGSNPDDNESFLISLSGSVTYEGNASGSVLMQVRSTTGPTMVTVEMIDSYGDGWNGAQLIITDEDNETTFTGTCEEGYSSLAEIQLQSGHNYFVKVTSGEYPGEVSWNIHSAGAVVASGGALVTGQDFSPFGNLIEVTLAQLGSYQLELANNTTYQLGAFLDVDGDGGIAPLEPAALHSEETIVATGNLSGINIEIVDNVAPTNLVLSAESVTENQPLGTFVGTFTAIDPDDSNGSGAYSFYLVGGEGSDANWAFAIEGNQLRNVFSLDYEDDFEPGPIEGLSYHPIRVRVSDNRGASIEKTFFITVSDDPLDNPLQVPMVKVDPPDGTKEDLFGSSVSLLGDLLLVGATEADLGDRNDTGATYLFRIEANGSSTYLSKLTAHDGNEEDSFGTSVSQSGDFFAIGATRADMDDRNDTGAAYVFHMETNDGTTLVAKVAAPDGSEGDGFGHSVSISDEFLSVGAPFSAEGEDGAVYLFRMEANGSVSHLTKLMAPDDTVGGNFGHSISESDDLLLIGANKADVDDQGEAGKAYLYRMETNGSATYLTRLTAPDGEEGDRFGQSVSQEGKFLAVGAPFADHNGISDAGIVYLYKEETNGSITLLAKVTAVDSAKGDRFGMAISQSEDLLAVMSGNGIYLYRVDANGSSIATALGKVSLNWQPEALYFAGEKLVVGHKKSELVHVVDLALLNNTAPSNLHLGNSTVAENQAHDTVVGNLHAIDPDDQNGSGDHFYVLADGNGSEHNILFRIDENGILRTKVTFDYETSPTLSIRVRTTDEYDASFEKIFTINVTNVVEDLDGDGIENHADSDDDGDGFTDTEEVEGGSNPDDNASFLITVSGTVTYEGNATGKIRVLVMEELEGEIEIEMIDSYGDGWNGAELTILDDANVTVYLGTFETGHEARDTIDLMAGKTYFVNVSDGEYPEEVSWNIFSENQVLATGDSSSAGASFLAPGLVTEIVLTQTGIYQLTIPSNLPFLVGAFLDLDDDGGIAPIEPAALHSEETIVATGNLSGINIEIVDNVAPTYLLLSVGPVTENRQAGSFVGIFSATDPDDLNGTGSYFFDLVDGNGSDHNHHFAIEDNQLKAVSPDYESGSIHSIRVRASDDRGAFLEKSFFITIIDDPVDNPLELESSTLFPPEPSDENQFGSAVALLGDLLAIGSNRASGVDENETGAAYLYEVEANGSTTHLTKLFAPDGSAGDEFGGSISLSHDLLAVGAARASGVDENLAGAVYLYGVEANGSTDYLTKLTAPDGTEWDYFGSSVSLSHDLLAVGATRASSGVDENRTGTVYLYGVEDNGSNTYLTKLTPPDGSLWDGFGCSVSQSGDLLAVGAGWADIDGKENAGAVYLYRVESNGTGTYLTKLSAPDGVAQDWFGSSVSVLDNVIVVSAAGVDRNGTGDVGAAYVYRVDSNDSVTYATYLKKLTARDATAYSYFGYPVSQAGDLLAVGSGTGTYLYRVDTNGSSITTLGKATLQGEAIDENFRTTAISVSGELLAVGILLENPEDETDEEYEEDDDEYINLVYVISLANLNKNRSPSDLRLSNATVDENKDPGTLVGQLQVVDLDDQNGTDQYHFELVDGNGSQHNHLFSQANGELKTNAFLDHETNDTLSIRVRVTDKYNATLEVPLEVKVIDTFAPIVRTLTVETDANGSTTFRGEILTDGNSEITVVGLKVSDGLNFVNPMILPGTPNGSTGEFTVTVTGLTAGTRYYYRAYATNAEGTGHGARKRFVTPLATFSAPPPWWSTAGETDGGWRISPWLGAFLPFDNGWMLHADMGWLYAQPDGADGLWLWNETHGWLWTNAESFRYLYSANTSEWLYFLKQKDGRVHFYNYVTGSVE